VHNMNLISFSICFVVISTGFLKLRRSGPSHIRNLRNVTTTPTSTLSFSPNHLSTVDIAYLIFLIALKYAAKSIGRAPQLKLASNGTDIAIPPLTLSAELRVSKEDVELFNSAVGVGPNSRRNTIGTENDGSEHSPLVLAALTTPIMLVLLCNAHFPILPFGAVNTMNRFEFLDMAACRAMTELTDVTVVARMGGPELSGRRVKRGVELSIIVEVGTKKDGKAGAPIFRQFIGILGLLQKNVEPKWQGILPTQDTAYSIAGQNLVKSQQLVLAPSAPVKWAKVCRDVNPIHMSVLAAKLLGFPGKIAHGNLVAAMVVEGWRNISEGGQLLWKEKEGSYLEVHFRKPMVLPLRLDVLITEDTLAGQTAAVDSKSGAPRQRAGFEVVKGGKKYVEGSWGRL
jgi:MaoC like domain